jgi:hypothetical protein
MKKFVFLTAIIFFGLSVNLAFAQILPFGGRITAIKTPPNVQQTLVALLLLCLLALAPPLLGLLVLVKLVLGESYQTPGF